VRGLALGARIADRRGVRITVTGATGHVGANLVRALLGRGDRVRALIHREDRSLAGLDVERVPGDVLEPASLDGAFAGAELVFHLAALISIQGDRGGLVPAINVGGAKNAAEAALRAGVRRFVHTSSVHAFDLTRGGLIDETSPRSEAPHLAAYDRSKAAGERAVREVVARGLDAVVVHPTGVIGPFDFAPSRMGRTLLGLRDRSLPSLVAGGFDFVDVRDVVQALLAAADRGRPGESFLAPGRWVAVDALGRAAAAITNVPPPKLVVPIGLARVGVPFASAWGWLTKQEPLYTGESLSTLAHTARISGAKAERELGYVARPLEETLRDAYAWFADPDAFAAQAGRAASGT
jgi:dihydroflavonol-4-reductase